MEETMTSVIIVAGLATMVVLICYRLKLPTIVGFLLTGVLVGPGGFNLLHDMEANKDLAELGVVLLLFVTGLEFSFKDLLASKNYALVGGSVQVGATIIICGGLAALFGVPLDDAIVFGILGGLSSTAIVLKLFQERYGLADPSGRCALLILVFQDLVAIPLMMVIPYLATGGQPLQFSLPSLSDAAYVIFILGVLFGLVPWGIPRVLRLAADTSNQELFILAVAFSCLGVAGFTAWAGMSMALGAFIAGMTIADSPYSQQAVNYIIPFRDFFIGLFFLSIGMLMDTTFVLENIGLVLFATAVVILAKALGGGLGVLMAGLPLQSALLVGFSLAQVGEFSFVLAQVAVDHSIIDNMAYQLFLAVSIVTMALSPLIMSLGGFFAKLQNLYWRLPVAANRQESVLPHKELNNHLIVVGFGPGGRAICSAAKEAGLSYAVVEFNPATVRAEQKRGENIVFGDASNPVVLEHVGIRHARVLVSTVPSPMHARRVIFQAHQMNPDLYIIARARFVTEISLLYELGAREVVAEEYEVAVEIYARLLRWHLVPQDEIDHRVAQLRSGSYKMLRKISAGQIENSAQNLHFHLPEDINIVSLTIQSGALLDMVTIAESHLRSSHHLNVLSIRRPGHDFIDPTASTTLLAGDTLIVMGKPEHLSAGAHKLFRPAIAKLAE